MDQSRAGVVVLGSANVDVVLEVDELPGPGTTVLALGSGRGPGGKGANQAVAAARSGAPTTLLAALGDDDARRLLLAELTGAGVDVGLVRSTRAATGTAYVLVDSSGENSIVVDPGANALLLDLTDDERVRLRTAAVVLCQLEVPLVTVAAALAEGQGLRVLNAAPFRLLPDEVTGAVDVLVVNEHEAVALAGRDDLNDAVHQLLNLVPEVVVTLGAEGALAAERGRPPVAVPSAPVRQVVDTTGAGDVFCGAYAAARAGGSDGPTAVRWAVTAAAISVERPGAARSAPRHDEVLARWEG